MRIVVIGAGMAGLTAARHLAETEPAAEVVVIDKGRGVGGRVATRRVGEATIDHGAQFLTTHSPEFAQTVAGWARAGVVRPWFRGQIGPHGVLAPDGHVRYRGAPTMNAIAKHLAVGLDVRLAARVAAVQVDGARWRVRFEDAAVPALDADVVLLTPPVPQSLDLLSAGGVTLSAADREVLTGIRYDPCLAVLAPLAGPSGLADPGAIDPASGPIDWMADAQLKGVSRAPAVTLHAAADYSRARWSTDAEAVATELLTAAGLASPALGDQVQVHRWRFARPTVLHPARCLVVADLPPLVLAGDAFGEAKIEGAALSGTAAAEAIRAAVHPA